MPAGICSPEVQSTKPGTVQYVLPAAVLAGGPEIMRCRVLTGGKRYWPAGCWGLFAAGQALTAQRINASIVTRPGSRAHSDAPPRPH